MRGKISFFLLFFFIFSGLMLKAQPPGDNCADALYLCPGVVFNASNQGATAETCAGCADVFTGSCGAAENTVWFSFVTNASGGDAAVQVTNISCLPGAGNGTLLQGVILSAAVPCDGSTYTTVSTCESGAASSFTLSATGLLPQTTYYVWINGVTATNPASCSFRISLSGTGVEVSAASAVTDQTCGLTDGAITVNSVSGGEGPYTYSVNGSSFQGSTVFSGLVAGTYTLSVQDSHGCVQVVDNIVLDQVNGPENGQAVATSASCNSNDGSIQVNGVTGGNPPYQYALNNGTPQSSDTFSGLAAGTYTLTVSDAIGCTQVIENVIVTNNSGPNSNAPQVTQPTCGNQDGRITFVIIGGATPYTYSLNGGPPQTMNLFQNLGPGLYEASITDANGCRFTFHNIVLTEQAPSLPVSVTITPSANPLCLGDQVTFSAVVTNGGGAPLLEWFVNGNSVQSGSLSTYTYQPVNGDVVGCRVVSQHPCAAVTTAISNQVTLVVNSTVTPVITLVSSVSDACSNEPVLFTATTDCPGTATYEWIINGTVFPPVASDTLLTLLPSTSQVEVRVTCDESCAVPATSPAVSVNVTEIQADAGADQIIAPGQSTSLNGSGGTTYFWTPSTGLSCSSCPDPVASPSSSTTYTLVVTNGNCVDTDEVRVVVSQVLSIPNTFTPNGDGVNDVWEIAHIENFPACQVTVYDRWGQRVFNSIGYSNKNAWNGTNNGLRLPAATYYYVIELNEGGAKADELFTGSITIVY